MPLSTSQKTAVSQFAQITSTDKKFAEKTLRHHSWDVQAAVDSLYNSGSSKKANAHEAALNKLFDSYRDDAENNPDQIGIEGTMKYFEDLSISLESISVLVISELLQSTSMGELPRDGFVNGWSTHGTTTTKAQKSVVNTLTAGLKSPDAMAKDGIFRKVYKHTFKIALPPGTRAVPLEQAIEYWKLLFSPQGWEWKSSDGTDWLPLWESFLLEKWKKAVNKDLWDQTLLFAEKTQKDPNMTFWSEDSAWPGIIDSFVEWMKEKRGVTDGQTANGAMEID